MMDPQDEPISEPRTTNGAAFTSNGHINGMPAQSTAEAQVHHEARPQPESQILTPMISAGEVPLALADFYLTDRHFAARRDCVV